MVKILRGIPLKNYTSLKPRFKSQQSTADGLQIDETVKHIGDQIGEAYQTGYTKGVYLGQEQGFQEGKIHGKIIGIEEGREDSLERLNFLFQTLQNLSSELQITKENLLNEIKPELIKFCLEVCKKILGNELTLKKSYHAMLDHLFSKLSTISKNQPVTLIISSEDLSLIEGYKEKLSHSWHINDLQIQADPTMSRGKCCLETSLGIVNFNIDRLLKNFESNVLEVD